jgi:hypothetical protein
MKYRFTTKVKAKTILHRLLTTRKHQMFLANSKLPAQENIRKKAIQKSPNKAPPHPHRRMLIRQRQSKKRRIIPLRLQTVTMEILTLSFANFVWTIHPFLFVCFVVAVNVLESTKKTRL